MASTPQKHPAARTTFSCPLAAARGSSVAGLGNGNFGSAGFAPMDRTALHPRKATITRTANTLPIYGLRMATPKVAARTAGLRSIKRYAGNDSLDAKFVFRVTKKLDGVGGVSLQKFLVSEGLS